MNQHVRTFLCSVFIMLLLTGCAKKEDKTVIDETKPEKTSGSVTVDGIEFHYYIEGAGKPLLVVGDALPPARATSDELRKHFMFVIMDSRMNIPSERQTAIENITMETLVDDIEAVRTELNLDDVCVLGHSIFGILALEYARKYPEHVSFVIMHATPPYWGDRAINAQNEYWEAEASHERKEIYKQNWEDVTEDSMSKLDPSEARIQWYILETPRAWHDPTYDCSWILKDVYWNTEFWDQLFDVIMVDYDLARGGTVETPVFLAIGKSDYAVPYYLWDDEREKLPNLSYNLFEKSGHYPMLEEQELFDKKLIEWISSH